MSIDQYALLAELFPLRRDLVSDGYDEAMAILAGRHGLRVHEFPTGTRCWTWEIPPRWSCREAWVETLGGARVIDQAAHPLHVASYSQPVDRIIGREELLDHVHVHPHLPDEPPFVFFYYRKNWGFCCGRTTRNRLLDDRYRVRIDSRFEPATLKVGELFLPGRRRECVVLCAHLDHPGQANDGLSGVVTALAVMAELARWPDRNCSYRLLVVPETIGSVAWLSRHEQEIPDMAGGLFVEMTGLRQAPALQASYLGDTAIDRCLRRVHMESAPGAWWAPYRSIVGNDERQFNAPGVRIPMLSYSRALPASHSLRPFREYHSAADDLEITDAAMLRESRDHILAMLAAWDRLERPRNLFRGEVCLARYDLAVDRHRNLASHRNMLRIMDLIDGTNSVGDIAEKLGLPQSEVRAFVERLKAAELVE